ncbi:DUF4240 domain-containing protein [Motilibacter deserti]|uniref:DUF4240 domain-containing protein n=1 Tax=Motilibacter deserti TaxID=2714956 RepID=A0ABX0GYR0_9ACTN|nr:DUF4240 domain-containing protein [Motilibacter deserti]NHC14358.1 DUF4240 domain-containing protein [Motilibacter deserti]
MTEDDFWSLVESARTAVDDPVTSADDVAEELVRRLTALPLEQIVGFQRVFDRLQDEAYRWDLWAAAYLVNGGCSDDGFMDFRGWLAAQGRAVWAAAVAAPDSLADVVPAGFDEAFSEEMLYVAISAYEAAGGDEDAFAQAASEDGDPVDEPAGPHVDVEDPAAFAGVLPRLAARYLPA